MNNSYFFIYHLAFSSINMVMLVFMATCYTMKHHFSYSKARLLYETKGSECLQNAAGLSSMAVQCSTVQYNTVQCAAQSSTVQCSVPVQYIRVQQSYVTAKEYLICTEAFHRKHLWLFQASIQCQASRSRYFLYNILCTG